MNRRALLAGGAAVAGGAALGLWSRVRRRVRLRPPGALAEAEFDRRCIRCFRCAEVCPPKCIRFDSLLELRGSDTPYIHASERACVLCMRCTEACPTGALARIPSDPEAVQKHVRMGVPLLDRSRCLPWNGGGLCRLCYYACPYADSAVVLVGPQQAPMFVEAKCVGCGLCEEACPRTARAIRVEPIGRRGA